MTDFLPVGEVAEEEVLERGLLSESSDSEEDGMYAAFQNPLGGGSGSDSEQEDDGYCSPSDTEAGGPVGLAADFM